MSVDAWLVLAAAVLGLLGGIALARGRSAGSERGDDDLRAQLAVQAAELRRIADQGSQRDLSAEQLRQGMEGARRALDELRVREQERRTVDDEQREVVRRLATVLAGGASKGRAGEHMLREHLAELPPAMLCTDFRVNGKVVEFGLLLPDGRRLPIDSKWTALAELEALEAAEDTLERDRCARAVERAVVARAKEVAQYLDPAVTAPVAVAAVPDAAYAVLKRAHADAYARGVVIVPYASALAIVLFLYSLVSRYGEAADVQASIAELVGVLDQMESVVENRFAKAAVMLTNGADEFRSQLGKARGSIARAQVVTGEPADEAEPPREDGPSLAVIR
ncbi:MAG: DNA recombination protein RmuC [Actinomycetota bacterium]